MKKVFYLLTILTISFQVFSQKISIIENKSDEFATVITVKIDEVINISEDGGYGFKMKSPIAVTSFAIGWISSTTIYQAGNFDIKFRAHNQRNGWSNWRTDDCLINPDQNPLNIYKSDLLFGLDEFLNDSIEFYLYPPENEIITDFYLILIDISGYLNTPHSNKPTKIDSKSCPEFPAIITRSGWCGTNQACINPTYTVTYRPNMTHTIIHHGASPTTYSDGAAVVYSYWIYHVNSNGWEDIGYNYLFDKYGNFFQGRKNPQMPNIDVHAAHAGNSNTYSIGCNFLGDSDSPGTAPTEPQIQKCTELLAWWYNHKNFDPTSSASILRQDQVVWTTMPRISGHRDVNVGGTSCPGNTLYALLPEIRTRTNNILLDCLGNLDTIAPTTVISTEKNWNNSDFEVNFIDQDNPGGSGMKYAFYNVQNKNTDNQWITNTNKAFFQDDFSNTPYTWTTLSGIWNLTNGDATINTTTTNSKIYSTVSQNAGGIFLYSFKIRFNGTATNARAAFHFLCDDVSNESNFENTGHSYAVFLYQTNNVAQIYRWTPYAYTSQQSTEINSDTWYDIKIILNTQTNEISLYKNNSFVMSWIDPAPIGNSGNYIVLKASQSNVSFDDMTVYQARTTEELITVGLNKDIPNENINTGTLSGKINSILIDNANNWSEIFAKNIDIDTTAPIINNISVDNQWQTQNFIATIEDEDELSQVGKRFYLVSDFDGNNWSANKNSGFAFDTFDELSSNWNNVLGNWHITDGNLCQTDESVGNSNISMTLNQTNDEFLYTFDMKFSGSGINRRAGFHYFSDNQNATERGNGYFIYFRLEGQTLEFYKVINNVFTQEKIVPVFITAGQWYNIKIIYNRISGKTSVYQNDVFIGNYIDLAPYQSGNCVSFRSGNSNLSIDNFEIYQKRDISVNITVGDNQDIRFQNQNLETFSAKIKSIVFDNADNISEIFYSNLNVDWTIPTNINELNVYFNTENNLISADWSVSSDENSDINKYWYSVGSSEGNNDLLDWTDNGTNLSFQNQNIILSEDDTIFVNVKSENNAGLFSQITTSDGIHTNIMIFSNLIDYQNLKIYPNPNFGNFYIDFGILVDNFSYKIIDETGKILINKNVSLKDSIFEIKTNLSKGIYFVNIELNGKKINKSIIID
ncbi:MAG: N-acetylmuramoyl-L-alanine amidase [Bacteroidales bacterium]|jgi:hypothetical protein|nr:N-acetylmuramoyl-L-alanine amidase [Bacteroidales bacterium]